MKKLLLLALVGLTVLTGCPSGPDDSPPATPGKMNAGEVVELGSTQAFLTLAQACNGAAISYTYSGTTTPNYLASRDGAVTSNGVFTAPTCGSALIGSAVTVTGSCTSAGVPHTAIANITVGSEIVTSIVFVAADVNLCGAAVCRAHTPTNITTPVCPVGSPTTIQYYVQINASCGPVFAPSDPALVSPIPPQCSTTISP